MGHWEQTGAERRRRGERPQAGKWSAIIPAAGAAVLWVIVLLAVIG